MKKSSKNFFFLELFFDDIFQKSKFLKILFFLQKVNFLHRKINEKVDFWKMVSKKNHHRKKIQEKKLPPQKISAPPACRNHPMWLKAFCQKTAVLWSVETKRKFEGNHTIKSTITINDVALACVRSLKYLGFTITSKNAVFRQH